MLPLHSEKVLHPSDFVTSVQLKPLLSKMYKVFSATVAAGDFLSTLPVLSYTCTLQGVKFTHLLMTADLQNFLPAQNL